MYVIITWLLLLVSLVTPGTQQKARMDWKTDSQMAGSISLKIFSLPL